ncbi:uroporphyrinogen decarboxylase [Bacteroidetes bacterium endosymbiont of Geopemphigus sp.]|uniref:uroporphyrinogen decarboxylase n=1 Tax=Bacteroidetes bacterium endosymbiont of Geopemphigus sp. TaxID=2047937 RepID=UPI000CD29914|nr:uroporphyrinogen decarboxylase [Bacteroidetes bacterium endosymbiont of Geopemphigus sp.]
MLQNDLLLRALKGEKLSRPPVWMMRQAGRYLPSFRKLKEKYDFFTRCRTPELVAEITCMPVHQIGVDAAILFSDILVVPQAMGLDFQMKENEGPFLEYPIRSIEQADRVKCPQVQEELSYVFEGIRLSKQALKNRVPLIGFAGAPWTIFCYAVEGRGSKTFNSVKAFGFSQPAAAHRLLEKITQTTIAYLLKKVESGADVIQIFDSWGGVLSPQDYELFSWRYTQKIVESLCPYAPVIVFAKGCWHALSRMSESGVSALGLDWTVPADKARNFVGALTLQGNLDPVQLLAPISQVKEKTLRMLREFDSQSYIANLGHGILPETPVENAQAFVEVIKEYR